MLNDFNGASDTAKMLGQMAEVVCQKYLSNGHRSGNYWQVGNVQNEKGNSLFVRLSGELSGPKAAGKWTDAATGEFGDLLDLIKLQGKHLTLRSAIEEALAFLAVPQPLYTPSARSVKSSPVRTDIETVAAARRLFNSGRPIGGTIAEIYLNRRDIIVPVQTALRFHPNVYYRDDKGKRAGLPALLVAINDNAGKFMALNRIWIDGQCGDIASIMSPKKALGHLLGNAARFGNPGNILIVGEGVETILSLLTARPDIAMAAALTANHLAAFIPPPNIQHLIIARDNDEAGDRAARTLAGCCKKYGIIPHIFVPKYKDFNIDLRRYGKAYIEERLTEILVGIRLSTRSIRPMINSDRTYIRKQG